MTCCCCAIGQGTGLGGVVGLGRIGEGVWWMTVDGNGYGAASLPGWGCCCMVGLLLHGGLFADERVGFVVLLFCAETG